MSKNPRRMEGTVSWSGMDKVGGKGNEKTTSDGQRVCERVGEFWYPHRPPAPPRLSSPPREGEGLPRGCLDLSLDLRVGTAPGFGGGGPKGGRPLLPLPRGQTPSRTFPITPPGLRSHAARTPASRAPRAQSPGPFPGTRTPARSRGSRWRLLALGSRPPDAARQQPPVAPSLPAAAAAETATAQRGGRAPPPARLGVGAGPPRGAPEPCPRGRSPAGPR